MLKHVIEGMIESSQRALSEGWDEVVLVLYQEDLQHELPIPCAPSSVGIDGRVVYRVDPAAILFWLEDVKRSLIFTSDQ